MSFSKTIFLSLLSISCFLISATSVETDYNLSAQSAIVVDADSGEILFEKDANDIIVPASTVKLLTAITALDYCDENETISLTQESIDLIHSNLGSSNINLQPGSQLSVRDCLAAMLIESGNECAYSLAQYVAEKNETDIKGFMDLVNSKAVEIGCSNTCLVDPCGLSKDENKTTAADLGKIAFVAYNIPIIQELVCSSNYDITYNDTETKTLSHTNSMLFPNDYFYYDKCIGGKTGGFNQEYCNLISYNRNLDKTLICVVINSGKEARYYDTIYLMKKYLENASEKEASRYAMNVKSNYDSYMDSLLESFENNAASLSDDNILHTIVHHKYFPIFTVVVVMAAGCFLYSKAKKK